MSKKNADREKEQKKDAEEEDEDDDLEDEDEDEEEEEDEAPAAAKPVDARRTRARHDDHGHDDHGHDHDDEESSDEDDPYWWTPHAVMSALVLVGVLGFFGVFNKVLGGLAPKGMVVGGHDTPAAAHTSAPAGAAAAPKPAEQREEFGAKHLLVQFKGSMRASPTITRSEEEAKARATEAMKKARGGTKFEDVVKEYSDEPGAAQRGGDLGKFRKGQMVPEFQNAVEKMKVGEISELVKTPFGYHVIQRTQ